MDFSQRAEIINGIKDVKARLEKAREIFNNTTDDALIDSAIYEIISLNAKYRYYLRIAKEEGIRGWQDVV